MVYVSGKCLRLVACGDRILQTNSPRGKREWTPVSSYPRHLAYVRHAIPELATLG
jgi:hypothetical protein